MILIKSLGVLISFFFFFFPESGSYSCYWLMRDIFQGPTIMQETNPERLGKEYNRPNSKAGIIPWPRWSCFSWKAILKFLFQLNPALTKYPGVPSFRHEGFSWDFKWGVGWSPWRKIISSPLCNLNKSGVFSCTYFLLIILPWSLCSLYPVNSL